MLKQLIMVACIAVPLTAVAEDKKPTAQQEKMATCN